MEMVEMARPTGSGRTDPVSGLPESYFDDESFETFLDMQVNRITHRLAHDTESEAINRRLYREGHARVEIPRDAHGRF